MDLNFSLLPSMPLKVLFTKNHVLKTLNRMVGLNASINTYLMLGEPCFTNQNFLKPTGPMPSFMQPSLLIVLPPLYFITNLHIKSYITPFLTFTLSKCLAVYVMPLHYSKIVPNLIPELEKPYFLVTPLV
jgi:hypothetical protein